MRGFGDIVQKAFYLGVGVAAYAGENAGKRLGEIRSQAQKLADEMVAKGEMNTEEAKRFVEDLMKQAQQQQSASANTPGKTPSEPRRIEILSDDEEPSATSKSPEEDAEKDAEMLRKQVLGLKDELRRLQRER